MTLVTAKKQHRCWKARACAYTHAYALCAREACLFFIGAVAGVLSVVASALLRVGWCRASICYAGERNTCGVHCTKIQWYPGNVIWKCQKWWCLKLNCHFSAIFSLFGAISTHILIGRITTVQFCSTNSTSGLHLMLDSTINNWHRQKLIWGSFQKEFTKEYCNFALAGWLYDDKVLSVVCLEL